MLRKTVITISALMAFGQASADKLTLEYAATRTTEYRDCQHYVDNMTKLSIAVLENLDAYDKAPDLFKGIYAQLEEWDKLLKRCEENGGKRKNKSNTIKVGGEWTIPQE